MSLDVKLFNGCDHLVDGVTYDLQKCPKCYGKGYYFDLWFDKDGQVITASDDIKLQQEMLKVLIDTKFKNLFHTNWGSQLNSMIGSKNTDITRNKIKVLAKQAEEYLQKVQVIEQNIHNNLNDKEIIGEILSVNIEAVSPTGFMINVLVKNAVDDVFTQTFTI